MNHSKLKLTMKYFYYFLLIKILTPSLFASDIVHETSLATSNNTYLSTASKKALFNHIYPCFTCFFYYDRNCIINGNRNNIMNYDLAHILNMSFASSIDRKNHVCNDHVPAERISNKEFAQKYNITSKNYVSAILTKVSITQTQVENLVDAIKNKKIIFSQKFNTIPLTEEMTEKSGKDGVCQIFIQNAHQTLQYLKMFENYKNTYE